MINYMRKVYYLFLLTSILFGCSKDSDEIISIKGITERDNIGNILGNEDITDWSSDTEFPDRIVDFLNFHGALDYSISEVASLEIYGYPNPFESNIYFRVSCSKKTVCRFVIVDESLKIYFVHGLLLNVGSSAINLSASYFPRNKNLRIYYTFYDSSETIYYKGHGDIRRK